MEGKTIEAAEMAEKGLRLMDTPEDVLSHAVLYMKIYFPGMPLKECRKDDILFSKLIQTKEAIERSA